MQSDLFPAQARAVELAKSFTGGVRAKPEKRRAHILSEQRAKSFDGVIDPAKVTRYCAGKAQGHDELTKKRGGAVGMMEGWREVLNEPVRQRVGLLQMSAHYNI